MAGIFVTKAPAGKPRCARCKRPFTPRKEGDRYGPKCTRIIAAAGTGDARQALEGHTVKDQPPVKKERVCRVCGCTDITPCPGGCAWIEPDLCSTCATDAQVQKKIREQMSAEESAVDAYRRAVII